MAYRYSFVIPHKNLPLLLKRCLSSIPQRNDVQIIVVDDASEDVPALQEVVREFDQVELVLNEEARGAGYARNVGLKKLDGRNAALKKYVGTDRISEFCRYFCTEPWGKMIKTSLVSQYGIRFDETPLANDFYFSVVSAYYARKVVLEDSTLYMYTVRPESLSYRLCTDESALLTRLNVYWGVQCFYEEHKVPYIPFYEFVFSGLFRTRDIAKNVISLFLREKKLPVLQVLSRYVKGKLYQYTKGVHL